MRVAAISLGVITVETADTQTIRLDGPQQHDRLRPMHPTSVAGVANMIHLSDLSESSIYRNLRLRYMADPKTDEFSIYTFIGPILVAVNPYRGLLMYGQAYLKHYREKRLGDLPPHIYAIADNAFSHMHKTKQNQCCIISGESGSGKTESAKHVVKSLAARSNPAGGQHNWVEQQVLAAGTVLEAFGNAKTIRNDNSSRFGKYSTLFFDASGSMFMASLQHYLLELSRLAAQARNERNYHVFYHMLYGCSPEQRARLQLIKPEEYNYLNENGCYTCEGVDDVESWQDLETAFGVLSIEDSEVTNVLKMLSGILVMGNVHLKSKVTDHIDTTEIAQGAALQAAAVQLGIDADTLARMLTTQSTFLKGETIVKPLSLKVATAVRDTLVKSLYSRLFTWIVSRINQAMRSKVEMPPNATTVGVLDVYGFEVLADNSFEQLCINYCNEHLHQYFVNCVFKIEQSEYEKEGINWQRIQFIDNQATLDLLSDKPLCVFDLINEETNLMGRSDAALIAKLKSNHRANPLFEAPGHENHPVFGIRHFAGSVHYNARGFLSKNRDVLSLDVLTAVSQSNVEFLTELFSDSIQLSKKSTRRSPTIATQFKVSLSRLLVMLRESNPFFVRCIKPNEAKKANAFDEEVVVRQLRYSGMMSTIEIRKAGYPHQHTFSEFRHRYQALGIQHLGPHAGNVSDKDFTDGVCVKILGPASNDSWQLGVNKVFLKDSHDNALEDARENIMTDSVLHIQRVVRGALVRQRHRKVLWAVRTIRKNLQRHTAIRNFEAMSHGFQRLQSTIKTYVMRANYIAYMAKLGREPSSKAPLILRAGPSKLKAPQPSYGDDDDEATEFGFPDPDPEPEPVPETPEERLAALLAKESTLTIARREKSQGLSDRRKALQEKQAALDKQKQTARKETASALAEQLETMPGIFGDVSSYTEKKLVASMFADAHSTFTPGSPVPTSAPLLKVLHDSDHGLMSTVVALVGAMCAPGPAPVVPPTSKQAILDVNRLFPPKTNGATQASNAVDPTPGSAQAGTRDLSALDVELETTGLPLFNPQACHTNLEMLRLITRLGIAHHAARDEVYCQLMLNILAKPDEATLARLWIVLGVCLGCFSPSNQLMKYLVHFLRNGPAQHAVYCEDRLLQTISRGVRRHPVSWVELQAVKFRQPIRIAVGLADGHTTAFLADSTSTVAEILAQVYKKLSISDGVGYSLCLEVPDTNRRRFRLMPSGFIMDAVSMGEIVTKIWEHSDGGKSATASQEWGLAMRREAFPPWYQPSADVVDLRLSYSQIVAGIRAGDYVYPNEKKLAKFAAKHYYVEYGPDLEYSRLRRMLPSWLPGAALDAHKLDWWAKQIQKLHARGAYVATKASSAKVQSVFVADSLEMWRLDLSFTLAVTVVAGPQEYISVSGTLCINHDGIQFVNAAGAEIIHIDYHYVLSVKYHEGGDELDSMHVVLPTSRLQFSGLGTRAAADLLSALHFELRRRSNFAIALQSSSTEFPYNASDQYLAYEKGDLLHVRRGFSAMQQTRADVENLATGEAGSVITKNILLLATVLRPTDEMLVLFRGMDVVNSSLQLDSRTVATTSAKRRREVKVAGPLDLNRGFRLGANKSGKGVIITFIDARVEVRGVLEPGDFITHINGHDIRKSSMSTIGFLLGKKGEHTLRLAEKAVEASREPKFVGFASLVPLLRKFGESHFRSTSLSAKENGCLPLWHPSAEPLVGPLLAQISGSLLASHAIELSTALMRWPTTIDIVELSELSEQIMGPALAHVEFRDEVYVQILRQMAAHENWIRRRRLWELLWLCCGIFSCGALASKLLSQVIRQHQSIGSTIDEKKFADACSSRVDMVSSRGCRVLPAHVIEIKAIRDLTPPKTGYRQIIILPDGSHVVVDVASSTQTSDITTAVASALKLNSIGGLFVEVNREGRSYVMAPEEFFFDCARKVDALHGFSKQEPFTKRLTVFVQKLLSVSAQEVLNENVDQRFIFWQELTKYLNGFYKCSEQTILKIAALLGMVFDEPSLSLRSVLPKDALGQKSAHAWKLSIIAIKDKLPKINVVAAQADVLKLLAIHDMFGTFVFEVFLFAARTRSCMLQNWQTVLVPRVLAVRCGSTRTTCGTCGNFLFVPARWNTFVARVTVQPMGLP